MSFCAWYLEVSLMRSIPKEIPIRFIHRAISLLILKGLKPCFDHMLVSPVSPANNQS
jgi:hypothetical protein